MREELLTRLGSLLKELTTEMEKSKQRLDQLKAQRERTNQAMKNFRDLDNLKKVIEENKVMVERNNREIEYQRYLVVAVNTTMNELKEWGTKEKQQASFEEYLIQLTNDAADLHGDHPFRKDKTFLTSLLDYYESIEDYTSCAVIQKQLKELS
ncbi:MAG: hypothetical protein H7Z75_14690 [Ferruginibacter sp.]|nr:hypothetical protein [Cytophagales bacterium]